MATEKLEIEISAKVQNAITGLERLSGSLGTIAKGAGIAALGIAGIAAKMLIIDPILGDIKESFKELSQEFIDAADPQRKYVEAIKSVADSVTKTAGSVFQLVNALESGKLTTDQARNAQAELIKQAPLFKDAFDKNGNAVKNLSDVLFNDYIPALVNTIKISAATEIINKKLKKSFETIATKGELNTLEKAVVSLKNIFTGFGTFNPNAQADVIVNQFKKVQEAQNSLSPDAIGKLIKETYDALGISVDDFGKRIVKNAKELKTSEEKLKQYKGAVEGVLSAYMANNAALDEQAKLLQLINDLQRKGNELQKSGGLPNGLSNPNDQSLRSTQPKLFVPEDLAALQGVEDKLINISDLVNNGISGGIDSLFNALANNQDPFAALALSAKRLVVELGAAVVKALILQAVSNAIAPGSGGAAKAGGGVLDFLLRGDILTGAIGGSATRRRRF